MSSPPDVAKSAPPTRGPLWPYAAAALSGLLLALCFTPFEQTWLAWVALCPLICALWFGAWPLKAPARRVFTLEEARAEQAQPAPLPQLRARRAFALGWVTGLVYFGVSLFWLHQLYLANWVGWLVLPPYLALYPALWALFFNALCQPRERWGPKFARRDQPLQSELRPVWLSSTHNLWLALLAAVAWVALEWVRGWLLSGFGWNGLGVTTHKNPALMQAAGLVGVTGLSFPIALASVIGVATINRFRLELGRSKIRPHLDFSLTMALLVIWFTYGAHVLLQTPPENPRLLRVALVQPNIPQEDKWSPDSVDLIFDQYRQLTTAAAALDPDLLIWPESATPAGLFVHRPSLDFWDEMRNLGRFNFLVGTTYDGEMQDTGKMFSYNSALMVNRTIEGYQVYHKIHLVPFGEFLPLRWFPPMQMALGKLVPGDFDRGQEYTLFRTEAPEIMLAPLICFEDTVPDLARRFIGAGGELFVNITNDGWFGESAATRQHMINAAFRCVENRRPMVRCANTGVSAYIDEFGRVQSILADEHGNTFSSLMQLQSVKLPPAGAPPVMTLFTRWGEWFALTCLGLTLLAVTLKLAPRRR